MPGYVSYQGALYSDLFLLDMSIPISEFVLVGSLESLSISQTCSASGNC